MSSAKPVDVLVGSRIRQFREAAPRTVDELAARLGITTAELVAIEDGQQRAGASTLAAAAHILGVDVLGFFHEGDVAEYVSAAQRARLKEINDLDEQDGNGGASA